MAGPCKYMSVFSMSQFLVLLFYVFLITISVVWSACHNFNGKSIEHIDFQAIEGFWYPLGRSRDAASRDCSSLEFKWDHGNVMNFTRASPSGEFKSQLELLPNHRFQDVYLNTSFEILSTDYTNHLIIYWCYPNVSNPEVPFKNPDDIFTIYGRSRHMNQEEFEKPLTAVVEEKVPIISVRQIGCSNRDGIEFNEEELVTDEIEKRYPGVWELKMFTGEIKLFDVFQAFLTQENTTRVLGYKDNVLMADRLQQKIVGSNYRIQTYETTDKRIKGTQEVAHLFFDGMTAICYIYDLNLNLETLLIMERLFTGAEKTAEDYKKLISKLNNDVQAKINRFVTNLKWAGPHTTTKISRKIDNSDVIVGDLEKISGIWELRMSSDGQKPFDIRNGSVFGDRLNTNYSVKLLDVLPGDESMDFSVVIESIEIIFNQRIVLESASSDFVQVEYLYVDDKYLVQYIMAQSRNKEYLLVLTRPDVANRRKAYSDLIERVSSNAYNKAADLFYNLTMLRSEDEDDTDKRQIFIDKCLAFESDEVVEFDISKFQGNWELRLQSMPLGQSEVYNINMDELMNSRHIFLGNVAKGKITKKKHSRVISTVDYLYHDDYYLVFYYCYEAFSAKESFSEENLAVMTRIGVPDDAFYYQTLIQSLPKKTITKIKSLVNRMVHVKPDLKRKKPVCRAMDYCCTDVNIQNLTGDWQLIMRNYPEELVELIEPSPRCKTFRASPSSDKGLSIVYHPSEQKAVIHPDYRFRGRFVIQSQDKKSLFWPVATDYETHLVTYTCQITKLFGRQYKEERVNFYTRGLEVDEINYNYDLLYRLNSVVHQLDVQLIPVNRTACPRVTEISLKTLETENHINQEEMPLPSGCDNFEDIAIDTDFDKGEGVFFLTYSSEKPETDSCINMLLLKQSEQSLYYLFNDGETVKEGIFQLVPGSKRINQNGTSWWILDTEYSSYFLAQMCVEIPMADGQTVANSYYVVWSREPALRDDVVQRLKAKVEEIEGRKNRTVTLYEGSCQLKKSIDQIAAQQSERNSNAMKKVNLRQLVGPWIGIKTRKPGFECLGVTFDCPRDGMIYASITNDKKVHDSYTLYQDNSWFQGQMYRRFYNKKFRFDILDTDYLNYLVIYHQVNSRRSDDYWTIYTRPNVTLSTATETYLYVKLRMAGAEPDDQEELLYPIEYSDCTVFGRLVQRCDLIYQ